MKTSVDDLLNDNENRAPGDAANGLRVVTGEGHRLQLLFETKIYGLRYRQRKGICAFFYACENNFAGTCPARHLGS